MIKIYILDLKINNMGKEKEYDLVILGAGAAGLTATIYAQRYGMKSVVIGKEFGGATAWAGEIENYPGFIGTGRELMDKFKSQAEKFGAEFITGDIQNVIKEGNKFVVELYEQKIIGKTIMSGLGSEHRKLNIIGEEKFFGKGLSVCATCDGNFFKGKDVVVIGGGDAAAKAILYLSEICAKVYASYRKEPLRCEPIYLERIKNKKNVELIYNSVPTEIIGENKVSGLKIKAVDGHKISKNILKIDGVFSEIGSDPIVKPFESLGLELDKGHIMVDKEGKTNIPGFYAAGDGTNNPFKQTITAAASGAIAAYSAYNYIIKGK